MSEEAEPKDDVSRETSVTTGGPDLWDRRTHVERINPGANPAHIPGQSIPHPRKS